MSPKQRLLKWTGGVSALLLVTVILASCASAGFAAQLNDGEITICHASGEAAAPYEKITLSIEELVTHARHRNDLLLPPDGECPREVQTGGNTGKVTLCHATSSLANPYNEITIDFNGLSGHADHEADIIPAPLDGCPSVTPTPGPSGTPTMTPTPTTTPAATATGSGDAKITICHATSSAKNPYVLITISMSGLSGHSQHDQDIIPAPAGGCPTE